MAVPEQLQRRHNHGRYLLTNQNLRFGNINWSFFIAGGVVVILIAVVYIAFKKRYWFW